jgi:membrane complex biogenesis BtpA family protein
MSEPPKAVLASRPLIIAALHLPDFRATARPMPELEDYLLTNLRAFADGGVRAVMIQDQTLEAGAATIETVATMSSLVRLARREFPAVALGVIVQAHDAEAPLAIAHAAGASFVRLKVFVGGAMTAGGARDALGVRAVNARRALGRPDIAILADVHDRTAVPLGDVDLGRACQWAQGLGADALILAGADFGESCARVATARAAGIKRPILIGGGVDSGNVGAALRCADGAIVSTALMRAGAGAPRWDPELIRRFMDAADA